jgi:hypothetical protein
MKPYPNFRDLERQSGVTWHELVELESGLAELLWEARQACVTCRRWSDVGRAFAPIRNTLTELVGFARNNRWHPVLARPEAYQIAYWRLYDAVAGLLPGRAGGATEAPEKQRNVPVTEPCSEKWAATATAGV